MLQMSRRKLLRRGTQAVLAGGVALSGLPTLGPRAFSKSAPQALDYYQKLGVTPFINAAGTYTVLSLPRCLTKCRRRRDRGTTASKPQRTT